MRSVLILGLLFWSPIVRAGRGKAKQPSSARSFCAADLSTLPMPVKGGPFLLPAHFEERALRPGLLRAQRIVCRCLPRVRRHHPEAVRADLHVAPEMGEVTLRFAVEAMAVRPAQRMHACLGTPVLRVTPMAYVTDMRRSEGLEREVLVYPILFGLR